MSGSEDGLAGGPGDVGGGGPPAYHVYVIELSPEALGKKRVADENAGRRADKPCVYVGQTARTP
jgi:hypothetical protein